MIGPSFRFRLERVRALRERREDEAKLQLAGAMASRNECQQALSTAADQVQSARDAQLPKGPSSAEDLVSRQAYLERVESLHRATKNQLQHHERNVAGHRDALTEAARDRQALERLKANRLADHTREVARQDAAALDEIAINGFRRRAVA